MPYIQSKLDIGWHVFDFSPFFPASDTIASISTYVSASGPVELVAQRSASGLLQTIAIDYGSCTDATVYKIECEATSSSGKRHTIKYDVLVYADPLGTVAIPPAVSAAGTYSAILSQSGTSAPVPVVNVNTLSGAIVWTRSAEGIYVGTLAGAFISGKTQVWAKLVKGLVGSESDVDGQRLTDDTIELRVTDYADNLVDGFQVCLVTVYTFA